MLAELTPDQWLRKLYAQIVERRPQYQRLVGYYDGDHPLAFSSQKFLEAFGGLFQAFADNWCSIVVDSVEERLNIEGFRVGEEITADRAAQAIWEHNQLGAQSQLGHTDSLVCGVSNVTSWYGEDGRAEITVESPSTSIVATHPKIRSRRLAALRLWVDEAEFEHAELFLPDRVYLLRSPSPRPGDIIDAANAQWEPEVTADTDGDGSMVNPLGLVPMVPLQNRPRLTLSKRAGVLAQSEIAEVLPVQDAVNKLVADMMVAAEYVAYPQRWATGVTVERDPATNEVVSPPGWRATMQAWLDENPATKFGTFETAELGNYVQAIEMLVQHIASITRTPPHYLNASADRLSGESIKAAETGLVAKTRRKQRHYGESWEEVMRLAGRIENNPALASAESMETIWSDAESRTESEHIDAVVKKQAINVPPQQLWEDAGYTPQQQQRFREMWAEYALLGIPDDDVVSF